MGGYLNRLMCAVSLLSWGGVGVAQQANDLHRIEASNEGSSSLLFTAPMDGQFPITTSSFFHEHECTVRDGLPNFFDKINRGEEVTVAFIGGSITQSDVGYRPQMAAYLHTQFPKIRFNWVNAGVAGTGTDLGAFRIREHVLRYEPDLVFIEFAVNGAFQPGMEGMVRQIITNNPHTDVCLIYTVMNGQTAVYQRGDIPINIQGLERIADHYNVASIHLGMEAAALEARGKLVWKGNAQQAGDRLVFSEDGIHPLTVGGNLYASAIVRGLDKMRFGQAPLSHKLPQPLFNDGWEHAGMYLPEEIAVFDSAWASLSTEGTNLSKFDGWFERVMAADKAGSACTFFFEGDMFGIFDIGGPEVGQLMVFIDDTPVELKADTILNRFNRYCNNRYRGQYDVIQLAPGKHKVTLMISYQKADKRTILGPNQLEDITAHPGKYHKTAIYLGRILLRGIPITSY